MAIFYLIGALVSPPFIFWRIVRADIKEEWKQGLDTLPQARGRLRSAQDTFCCWGVLCEVAVKHGLLEWVPYSNDMSILSGHYRYLTDSPVGEKLVGGYPDDRLLEWAEIDRNTLPEGDIVYYLAEVNDNGSNFAYIKSLIDQHL